MKVKNATPQTERHGLLVRWMTLLNMVTALEADIVDASEGVFTPDEEKDALMALERVWDALTNERPKFVIGGVEVGGLQPLLQSIPAARKALKDLVPVRKTVTNQAG